MTVNQSSPTTFNGGISGNGNLIKNGIDTLTLGGTNAYIGTTTVNSGVLSVSGGAAIPDARLCLKTDLFST